ncbi:SMC family ATPase, partial [Paenibacillus alba]
MRPIQLQMSGLQSYRELQTINFGQLVDAGVFGIFGPTGSGKSSILDAITLALYGKVERASGGTQAIMNHAEQTLFVSFTFELTNAAGTERYHVERQFKRGTEMSINGTITRLLHIKEGETVVLADKAGEVNQQVQHILGLSMQDFTRAVVLPQGKFAEFLTLTGKDRRQMLQRLFHLEQYGDHLSAKVSSKVKETDSAVKQLAAEQQGLGDASEQALQEAKEKLLQAEAEEIRSRIQLEQQEIKAEELKQVFQWQQDKEQLEAEWKKQQEQEDQVREKELLLLKAEQADRVKPYLEQFGLAASGVQTTQIQLEQASKSQHAAETAYEAAAHKSEQAQLHLAQQEGPLLLRLDQLEQALVIGQELNQVQLQIQAAQQQEAEVKSKLTLLQAEVSKSADTKQKAILKQSDLKDQLKQVETNAASRQLLHSAVQDKKAIEQLQGQELEARKTKTEKADVYTAVEHNQRLLASKRQAIQTKLFEWLKQSADLGIAIRRNQLTLTAFIPNLQLGIDREKKRWKLEERHALAAILANDLHDGEQCPVCGAIEHPYKKDQAARGTAAPAQDSESAEERIRQGEELLQLAKEKQFSHNQLFRRLETAAQQAVELAEEHDSLAWQQAAVSDDSLAAMSIQELDEASSMDDLFTQWHKTEIFAADYRSFEELERAFQSLLKEQTLTEQQVVQAAVQQEAAASLLTEATNKLTQLEFSRSEQLKLWQQRYVELAWETVEQQLEQLLANERLAEELRSRIEKSIPFLDELNGKLEELQLAVLEQDRTALQLHERLQGLAQLAADKSRQLALRAPGAAVPQLIAEATSALAQLRQLAQTTKLAHAEAQREQLLAAQRFS